MKLTKTVLTEKKTTGFKFELRRDLCRSARKISRSLKIFKVGVLRVTNKISPTHNINNCSKAFMMPISKRQLYWVDGHMLQFRTSLSLSF